MPGIVPRTGDSEQRKPLSLGVFRLMSWLQALTSGVHELPEQFSHFPKEEETQERMICLSLLSWAIMTKHHRLGGLNSRNVFFTVLEAERPNIKLP